MSRRTAKDGASAYLTYQQKRRAVALERQKNARHDKFQLVRSLAQAAMQDATGNQAMHKHTQQHVQQDRHDATATASTSGRGLPTETQLYGMDGIDVKGLSGNNLKAYFARQLMQPEWISDIPPDLSSNWLVMPRPEGKRCLVISTGGRTFSRSRTGAILHTFYSRLPGGGPRSNSGAGGSCYCVLDCIFQDDGQQQGQQQDGQEQQGHKQRRWPSQQQQQQVIQAAADTGMSAAADTTAPDFGSSHVGPSGTYYIQDVLAWRGYSLVDCGAEFRLFWLQSKMAEEVDGSWTLDGGEEGPAHQHRFTLLTYWKATTEGLSAAAGAAAAAAGSTAAAPPAAGSSGEGSKNSSPWPFVQDGIYLRHVEGHYCLGGNTTPLALLWKDENCSRYLLDTDAAGVVPQYQQLVLEYQGPETAGVATADDPPVVLGRLPQEFIKQMGNKLRKGRLLRFSIREGGILFNSDGSPAGADLAYEGPANQRRGRADLISKVLFQWQARKQPCKLESLIAAAAIMTAEDGLGAGNGSVAASDASAPAGEDMML